MKLQDQPAYIIKMRAKSGMGDKLFELSEWRSPGLRTVSSSLARTEIPTRYGTSRYSSPKRRKRFMRTAHLPTNSGMRSSTCWPSLPCVLQFILTPHFQSTSPDNWHVGRNNIAPSLVPGAAHC